MYTYIIIIIHMQISSKDVIAQEIFKYQAIGRISKILDQLADGLSHLGVMKIVRCFPILCLPLLSYTVNVSPEDVSEAVYVEDEENLLPSDAVSFTFVKKFINESTEDSM